MIDWRDPDGRWLTALPSRVLARWGAAAVVVVAVHAAAMWYAMHWRSAAEAAGEPPPAVMIDLSPLSVAPDVPPQELAPGPQMTEAQPDTTPAPQETPKPQPDATPEPTPPPPDVKVPELPKANDAAATLTPPPPPEPPKPVPPKEAERKPAKPPPKKKPEHKKPREPADHAAPRTSAPPPAQRAERAAAAAGAGVASSAAAAASWRSELMAHLNRYKRFPSGAGSGGVATIAFTINRSGQVTGSRLLRSSGDSVLDAEAVALPRRASPVPAPPPGTGGSSIGLAVPIRFSR